MVGRPRMFHWALQCWFCQFEKVPNFVSGQAFVLSYPVGDQLLFIEVKCVFTLICIRYLCVSLIRQTDTKYKIFKVPTWSFNACVYTCVLFAEVIYSVPLNGCFLGVRWGVGAWAPLWNPARDTGMLTVHSPKCFPTMYKSEGKCWG